MVSLRLLVNCQWAMGDREMEPLDIEVGLEQLRAELAGVNVKKTEWAIKVIFKVLFGLIRYLEEREARHRRITMATLGLRDSRLGEDGAE